MGTRLILAIIAITLVLIFYTAGIWLRIKNSRAGLMVPL